MHTPVDGLAHVVDGEQTDADGGERLHFDAGAAEGAFIGEIDVGSHESESKM